MFEDKENFFQPFDDDEMDENLFEENDEICELEFLKTDSFLEAHVGNYVLEIRFLGSVSNWV
jgi:hypothetical protein